MNKFGITSNVMKIIAFVAIIFDHIGVYFYDKLPIEVFYYFRVVGRFAMPIFAYMIVQGFFYTKDLTKYVKRLIIAGVVTQLTIYLLHTLNNYIYPDYSAIKAVLDINIIITFAISLIILKAIDNLINKISSKERIKKEDIILTIVSILPLSLYFITKFDYSFYPIIYIIMLYVIEKIIIEKKAIKDKYISKIVYILLNFLALIIFTVIHGSQLEYFAILSIFVIAVYNHQRGKKSKALTWLFYIFYPFQHLVLYLLAMILSS